MTCGHRSKAASAGLGSATGFADRIGIGTRVIETYPIAALRLWRINTRKYKNDPDDADRILHGLCETTGLAEPDGYEALPPKIRNDAVDAFVCALIARTAELVGGRTAPTQ
jgi:Protein of unknown function (DUF429)